VPGVVWVVLVVLLEPPPHPGKQITVDIRKAMNRRARKLRFRGRLRSKKIPKNAIAGMGSHSA